jgi:hypothetical protein
MDWFAFDDFAVGGTAVAARADDERSPDLFGPRPTVWGLVADPLLGGRVGGEVPRIGRARGISHAGFSSSDPWLHRPRSKPGASPPPARGSGSSEAWVRSAPAAIHRAAYRPCLATVRRARPPRGIRGSSRPTRRAGRFGRRQPCRARRAPRRRRAVYGSRSGQQCRRVGPW